MSLRVSGETQVELTCVDSILQQELSCEANKGALSHPPNETKQAHLAISIKHIKATAAYVQTHWYVLYFKQSGRGDGGSS